MGSDIRLRKMRNSVEYAYAGFKYSWTAQKKKRNIYYLLVLHMHIYMQPYSYVMRGIGVHTMQNGYRERLWSIFPSSNIL